MYVDSDEEETTNCFLKLVHDVRIKVGWNKNHGQTRKTTVTSGAEGRIYMDCSVDETMKAIIKVVSAMTIYEKSAKISRWGGRLCFRN